VSGRGHATAAPTVGIARAAYEYALGTGQVDPEGPGRVSGYDTTPATQEQRQAIMGAGTPSEDAPRRSRLFPQ
jgi:hypothetical protein